MRWLLVATALLATTSAFGQMPACEISLPLDTACTCDARTLHPLQGAIGREEASDKARKIANKPEKYRRDLKKDPVAVVYGPGRRLFITDHHHGAESWRLAGQPMVICRIAKTISFATDDAFWAELERDHLVHFEDADGKPLRPDQLPDTLAAMPDDPYRSLAWRLRQAGGFCRAETQKEFAEFTWADWMRQRPELPLSAVRHSTLAMLPVALKLALGAQGRGLPGYVGDKPSGFTCAKDD